MDYGETITFERLIVLPELLINPDVKSLGIAISNLQSKI
jgi:hypothetical protein